MNISVCEYQFGLVTSFGYRLGQTLHLIGCLTCIIASIFVGCFFRRQFYLHPNLKTLFLLQFFFALVHSMVEASYLIHHQIRWFTAVSPCDGIFQISFCIHFLAPFYGCQYGLVFVQFACGIERLFASFWNQTYENMGGILGIGLSSMVVLFTAIFTYYVLEPVNLNDFQGSCGITPISINHTFANALTISLGVDNLTTVLFVVVYQVNAKNIKRATSARYRLGKRYQGHENIKVIRLIYPCVIAHTLLFTTFFVSRKLIGFFKDSIDDCGVYAYRLFNLYSFTIPYYAALMPLLFLWNIRRLSKRISSVKSSTSPTDLHFQQLFKQWETKT